ncbi:MAG: biopolymer transporter ExbD [Bdellovibrionales bacterium]|nr:biopolymer transporter ExbD [Bdellovibrionales bacterium]
MSEEIQSSIGRVVRIPGNHISPKYDMNYLRQKRDQGGAREFDVVLPLTSMIDMFSMLVIFLLLNFSATGEAFFVNKNITLPSAKNATPIESLPLISITEKQVSLDSEIVGSNPVTIDLKDQEMPALRASLARLKTLIKNQEEGGIPVKKGINMQADENTDVVYIKRVMNILVSEGFGKINFVTREELSKKRPGEVTDPSSSDSI